MLKIVNVPEVATFRVETFDGKNIDITLSASGVNYLRKAAAAAALNKVELIKEVRAAYGIGLKEAKDVVDSWIEFYKIDVPRDVEIFSASTIVRNHCRSYTSMKEEQTTADVPTTMDVNGQTWTVGDYARIGGPELCGKKDKIYQVDGFSSWPVAYLRALDTGIVEDVMLSHCTKIKQHGMLGIWIPA